MVNDKNNTNTNNNNTNNNARNLQSLYNCPVKSST